MSLALAIRRTTTGGPSTVDKTFTGGDRYVGQWEKGLVSILSAWNPFQLAASPSRSLQRMHGCTAFTESHLMLMQPEGEGKYVWTDQSTYEGGWKVHISVCSDTRPQNRQTINAKCVEDCLSQAHALSGRVCKAARHAHDWQLAWILDQTSLLPTQGALWYTA